MTVEMEAILARLSTMVRVYMQNPVVQGWLCLALFLQSPYGLQQCFGAQGLTGGI
jgi:hypothetical protein